MEFSDGSSVPLRFTFLAKGSTMWQEAGANGHRKEFDTGQFAGRMACAPATSQRSPELKAFESTAEAKEVDLATEMARKARVEGLLERRNLIDCNTLGRACWGST